MDKFLLYSIYFIAGLFGLGVIFLFLDNTFLRNRFSDHERSERGGGMMGIAVMLFGIWILVANVTSGSCSGGNSLPSGPTLPPPVSIPSL